MNYSAGTGLTLFHTFIFKITLQVSQRLTFPKLAIQ